LLNQAAPKAVHTREATSRGRRKAAALRNPLTSTRALNRYCASCSNWKYSGLGHQPRQSRCVRFVTHKESVMVDCHVSPVDRPEENRAELTSNWSSGSHSAKRRFLGYGRHSRRDYRLESRHDNARTQRRYSYCLITTNHAAMIGRCGPRPRPPAAGGGASALKDQIRQDGDHTPRGFKIC